MCCSYNTQAVLVVDEPRCFSVASALTAKHSEPPHPHPSHTALNAALSTIMKV